jgi:hypothetical protein
MTEQDWAAKVMPEAGAFKAAFSTSTMAGSVMRLYRQLVPESAARQHERHNRP